LNSKEEVADLIRRKIAKELDVDPEAVVGEANLCRDLGASSLEEIEIIMQIEEAFNLQLSHLEWDPKVCVNDLIEVVWGRVRSDHT
jgi:acyl carrier protein